MKFSYKILKKYLPYIENAQKVRKKLIMHTAEVEEIHSQKKDFENIVYWKITKIKNHPNADNLKICNVDIWEKEDISIICWWSNTYLWQGVAVAKIWAQVLWHWEWEHIIIKKTKIRWVESFWMICASKEIWLEEDFPPKNEKEILDLSFLNEVPWKPLSEILKKDDEIIEIDNKAINHRVDMFSYMWLLREISTIYWKKLEIDYKNVDFSKYKNESLFTNEIPNFVKRYSLLSISWVSNIKSNEEIETIIKRSWHTPKWLLIDVSNYSLYFYSQPAHIFDRDKVVWKITIRFAKEGEEFLWLDNKEYKLSKNDIVIADEEKILALGWIMWDKRSAVSDNTKNILIECAHFDQAILRISWKRLWIRTDSLNVFEKDTIKEMIPYAMSLIYLTLKDSFPNLNIDWYKDCYNEKEEITQIDFDLNFYNNLIWTEYNEKEVLEILRNLWIEKKENKLIIPFFRKDLHFKADIAEEIARIKWYDKIIPTIPSINIGAVIQNDLYKLKNDARNFFSVRWFFDVYNYSFVWKELYDNLNLDINNCIKLKNSLRDDKTHLRNSLIPLLIQWISENIRNYKNLKLFEFEKAFFKKDKNISEDYLLSWVITSDKQLVYYDIQNIVSDFLKTIFTTNYYFDTWTDIPWFAHSWRTRNIIVKWEKVWIVWEIHPIIGENFWINKRIWFFEINVWKILWKIYNKIKAKELSIYQASNFDISFVIDKSIKWIDIENTIKNTNKDLIQKVELFDIYENEEKLAWKRSLSFKVYIQSQEGSISDELKNSLIKDIISKVEKKWWFLR